MGAGWVGTLWEVCAPGPMPLPSLLVVGQKSAWDQLNALIVHNIYHSLVFSASRQECQIWGGGGRAAYLSHFLVLVIPTTYRSYLLHGYHK